MRKYLVNVLLLETGIFEDLLDRLHGFPEQVHVQLLELGPGQGFREVVAVFEGFDLDPRGLLRRQGPLGLFDLPLQLAHSPEVTGNVGTRLLLVELDEVVDDTVVEVLTTEMGITGGSQDLEDSVIDGEKGDIESSTTEIVDDDLRFATFLVKTVGDGCSGRLVDDTKDLKTGNGTGILGGLTLGVVEVCGDGDNSMGDLLPKVSLGGLLHLRQDHGGNFFRSKLAVFAKMFDRNRGLSVLLDNLEWPVRRMLDL